MKKRLKSLAALLMACMISVHWIPMNVYADASVITTDYTLTEDSSADGYIVASGGILRFAENLTVNHGVELADGYLSIPSTATMNGVITTTDSMGQIENAGQITSELELSTGTLINTGQVNNLAITGSGMLYAENGSSFGVLDISDAGSTRVMANGTFSISDLYLDADALSTGESSAAQMNIGSHVRFMGTTVLEDVVKVVVESSAKITTEGQAGLSVWKDGIKYPLPATTISGKTLSDIYSVSTDKSALTFTEQPVGYQTTQSKTVTVTNDGLTDVILKFAMTGKWEDMFRMTASGQAIGAASQLTLAKGDSVALQIKTQKGLSAAAHSGTLSVKCCTSEGTVYDTHKITGKMTVNKVPSIAAPTGDFYTLSGTKGNHGFYTSNVKVTPMDGYSIAKTMSDAFKNTITYTKTVNKPTVYLQKDATGQITEKAKLSAILIDKNRPEVENAESGKTYYKDRMTVTVTDDHLHAVTLNGSALTVTDGKASLQLNATDGKVTYTLRAEDLAGNIRSATFYLSPAWRKDGTVPSGKPVTLYKNKKYTLGSGTWTVSGDPTSYAGGNSFYVTNDGQYTMQSVN